MQVVFVHVWKALERRWELIPIHVSMSVYNQLVKTEQSEQQCPDGYKLH